MKNTIIKKKCSNKVRRCMGAMNQQSRVYKAQNNIKLKMLVIHHSPLYREDSLSELSSCSGLSPSDHVLTKPESSAVLV